MFSIFNAYDDEGYFLMTIRAYLSGQPLYSQISTTYGPFYYETLSGLFKVLGVMPTTDSGRIVTIAVWLAASVLGGAAAYRLTQSIWLALGAQVVTFYTLVALVAEPIQPAGEISLLLVGIAFAASFKDARPRAAAGFIGASVAALLLVKINVGVFAAGAAGFGFAASLSRPYRRLLLPLMAAVLAVVPPLLMKGLWGADWVLEFAAVASISTAAVALAVVAAVPVEPPRPSLPWLMSGGVLVILAVLAVAAAGGNRLQDVLVGPLLLALRFPSKFSFPLRIGPGNVAWAALWLAAAASAFLWRAHERLPLAVTAMVRIAGGFIVWATLLRLPTSVLLLALPIVWLAALPGRGAPNGSGSYARILLPALAVLESLQAYPVAGTQLALSGVALVPVGAMIISDGMRELRRAGLEASPPRRHQGFWVGPAALLIGLAATSYLGYVMAVAFSSGSPTGLAGAQLMRLPGNQATELRNIADGIQQNCDSFITLPAMNSFYVWTSKPTLFQLYSELWWTDLTSLQQQSVVQQIEGTQRLCVIKDQRLLDFWADGRPVPMRPLVEFINGSFVVAGTFGEYQLLVRSAQ